MSDIFHTENALRQKEKENLESGYATTLRRIEQMRAQWTPLRGQINALDVSTQGMITVFGSDSIRKIQDEEKRVQQDRKRSKLIQEANQDLPAGLAALEGSKAVCVQTLPVHHFLSVNTQVAFVTRTQQDREFAD